MTAPPAPVPVAAAAPVVPLLIGPPLPATVLGVFAAAALLAVDSTAGPRVVCLLSTAGSGVPNGIRTPLRPGGFAGLVPGGRLVVGHREVRGRGLPTLRFARSWPTAVPIVRPAPSGLVAMSDRLADAPLGVPRPRVRALAEALTAGEPAGAVRGLVGLGQGLTPGGDDVLAGAMVGLRATGRTALLQWVRRAIGADVAERTTLLSADLLRLAARGHAGTEAVGVLRALHAAPGPGTGDPGRRRAAIFGAVDALLAVGHTSGADLATGLLLGLHPGFAATTLLGPRGAADPTSADPTSTDPTSTDPTSTTRSRQP